jgi:hypothetical protein
MDEKIVEIRGKFNAGDFAGAAAPGMELVSKLFSAQEALIRTGVSGASSAMVKNIKSLKSINEDLQLEIQKITFESIRPIEQTIEKLSRDLEIKVTRVLEAYQEEISDLQHVIKLAFEDPIADINAENTIMSNDMEIMNHAAEEINKRYDEQAEALTKVSDIKSQLVEQEKEQLDLADALSKGDIGAAARAIQAIRATQAARNAENASKALELSRKNKIDNLRGKDSGLSKDEITERQYQNAQTIYDLENRATTEVVSADGKTKELLTRLQILDRIEEKNRLIYDLEEDREARQLAIRAEEDKIYAFKQKVDEKQYTIDKNNLSIATDERAIEKLVENITVLGKTKDVWDGITAKIEASSLAGQDFDGLMGGMLASVDKIDEGWKSITDTMSKYSSSGEGLYAKQSDSVKAVTTEMATQRKEMIDEYNTNATDSKNLIDGAKEKIALAQEEYDIAKKKYDLELESMKAQLEAAKARNDYQAAGMINSSIAAYVKKGPPVAPVSGPNSKVDNANINYNDVTDNAAQDIYDEASAEAKDSKSLYTYKGTGGATGGSQSSGGGGGNSTPLTPAQKKAAADKAAADKKAADAKAAADKKAAASAKVPAGTAMTQNEKATLQLGTHKRMESLEKIAKDKESNALAAIKTKYGTDKKNSDTYRNLTGQTRTDFDTDYAKYEALKKEAETWNLNTDGKSAGAIDAGDSLGARNTREKLLKDLPKWVQDAVKLIDKRAELWDVDIPKFTPVQKKYYAAKDDMGIGDNWSFKQIEEYKPFMEKYGDLFRQYKSMSEEISRKNRETDLARTNLTKAGYNKDNFLWAFEDYYVSGDRMAFSNPTPSGFKPTMNTYYYSRGGSVASGFAQKGISLGTDIVPAMLTPGEFVMSKFAVQSHGTEKMKAINNGQSLGDSVYNYSISVNVKSESNPDEIARTVIAQIKSVDAQKMRGVRT